MRFNNKYSRFLIAIAIVHGYFNTTYSQIFNDTNSSDIKLCTADGIKFISPNTENQTSNDGTSVMLCCLDVHSNFIISLPLSYKPYYFKEFKNSLPKIYIQDEIYLSKLSIRAPPIIKI